MSNARASPRLGSLAAALIATSLSRGCHCATLSVAPGVKGSEWLAAEPIDSDLLTPIPFTVALHPRNVAELSALLDRISDPTSPDYGQYITSAEVIKLTAADPEVVKRVAGALSPATCESRGDSLRCQAAPKDLSELFKTSFQSYQAIDPKNSVTRRAVVATQNLVLPALIAEDVAFVSGLSELPWRSLSPKFSPETNGDSDAVVVVPDSIRLTYNVSSDVRGTASTVQSVAEFGGSNNEKQSDLTIFGNDTGLGDLQISKLVGPPNDPQADMTEATLDIQYIAGVGVGNTNWVWNSQDWMFELCASLITATERPSVVSVSYAWSESEQCHGLPGAVNCSGTDNAGYINRTNIEFMKVGVLGTTVLSASGDSGAHGRTDKVCLLNAKMHPNFPAASPFVTSVGGTQYSGTVDTTGVTSPICKTSGNSQSLLSPCAGKGKEIVASTDRSCNGCGDQRSQITTGGGFSDYSPRPVWQAAAVDNYLKSSGSAVPRTDLFNEQGRGYPDISALAHSFVVVENGEPHLVDGTSAATPTVAGLVGLINAHRLSKGRPAVGFFNPLLYKILATDPAAFNDITEGNNRCTESGCFCKTGFGAAPGWDAATGVGTPNFGRIIEAIDRIDDARESLHHSH